MDRCLACENMIRSLTRQRLKPISNWRHVLRRRTADGRTDGRTDRRPRPQSQQHRLRAPLDAAANHWPLNIWTNYSYTPQHYTAFVPRIYNVSSLSDFWALCHYSYTVFIDRIACTLGVDAVCCCIRCRTYSIVCFDLCVLIGPNRELCKNRWTDGEPVGSRLYSVWPAY